MGANASFSYVSEADYVMRYFEQLLPVFRAMVKRNVSLTRIFAAIKERLKTTPT